MGKKIQATFKGQNGSMGFKTGKEYTLTLSKMNKGHLMAEEDSGFNFCEYGSFMAFLNNWDNIKTID